MQPSAAGDVGSGLAIALIIIAVLVALFLFFRQFVLWYFRINERTELLKDIRDSLRQPARNHAWEPDPQLARASEVDQVRRRSNESEDQFNSRVADQLERQLRS